MEPGAGIVNPETFALATYSLIEYQKEQGVSGLLVTARDTRPSSEVLHQAVIAAGLKAGVEVISLDVAPTPTTQKIAQEMGAMATVVVTASHNPSSDNGWKGMLGISKPSREVVAAISKRYWGHVESGLIIPLGYITDVKQRPDMLAWYADQVVQDVEQEFGAQPLAGKVFVVDGAYGAAQQLTPKILRQLGATVEEFCCDGSGIINDGCGAAHLDGLRHFLRSRSDITGKPNFVGALANDGDADRLMGMAVMPGKGSEPECLEINGNHVMAALAKGQPGIVGTEYTNTALVRHLKAEGIAFEYCANGDVFVTAGLRKKQATGEHWTRGGEFTGHLIDMDWLSSGDGVRMAAWFAAYVASKDKTFADVYTDLPLWAETMDKVKFTAVGKDLIKQDPDVLAILARAEAALGENGRIILRPSGTEPVVRIWGEGLDGAQIKRTVREITDVVRAKAGA
jgi:phosphoglucosamine mutase